MDIITFKDFDDLSATYGDYPAYVVRYTQAVNQGDPPPPMLTKGAYYATLQKYHRLVQMTALDMTAQQAQRLANELDPLKRDLLL